VDCPGWVFGFASNVIDVVVHSLPKKLKSDASRLETVRGVGYRLAI
jgi:DNA-binding response OmpR family regulator